MTGKAADIRSISVIALKYGKKARETTVIKVALSGGILTAILRMVARSE